MSRQRFIWRAVICCGLSTGFLLKGFTQINEPAATPVYDYLYRMAQKGLVDWRDYQGPLDRRDIHSALRQLARQDSALNRTEASELSFYLREYAFDSLQTSAEHYRIFKPDNAGRFRTALYQKGDSRVFIDPVVGFFYFRSNGKDNRHSFAGIRAAGYFGERWGFNFFFRDNTEKGDTLARDRLSSREEGPVPTISNNRLLNYSQLNFNLSYRWKTGTLSLGKDNLTWGYGVGGNMTLSGKAPSHPFIKLDFTPWRWLHFSYFHGWLQSNIIDSARSYNTGTGTIDSRREVFHPKYIASHTLFVTPAKGLTLALGESVVYSDALNIGYLIPVSFFRAFDHYASRYNIKAGDNAQFFGMISSRNQLRNTHLYAQVFVDEIRISRVFNRRERRNQLGYTLGFSRTDLFFPYLTAGAEYTRINPFVYSNLIPTQTYQSHGFPLGDWMGANADRLHLYLLYTPLPRLRLQAWGQRVRKGAEGTLDQQYFQQPQPPFLFGLRYHWREIGGQAQYEWRNRLVFLLKLTRLRLDYVNAPPFGNSSIKLGVSYGL